MFAGPTAGAVDVASTATAATAGTTATGGACEVDQITVTQTSAKIGTIHILRHHIFGIFGPPSPPTSADVMYEWSLSFV